MNLKYEKDIFCSQMYFCTKIKQVYAKAIARPFRNLQGRFLRVVLTYRTASQLQNGCHIPTILYNGSRQEN